MAKKKLLMLNLEDDVSKDLAQVISNKSCRKILDYLSQNEEATEGEIAKALNLPLSTTNYSIKQLIKAELIVAEEYHYSKKGKEVQHYKLANQFIIIAPKQTKKSDLKKQLKEMLGLFGVSIAGAFGIGALGNVFNNLRKTSSSQMMMATDVQSYVAHDTAGELGIMTREIIETPELVSAVQENVSLIEPVSDTAMLKIQESVCEVSWMQELFLNTSFGSRVVHFLLGAFFVILIYSIYIIIKNKRIKRKLK